MAAGERAQLTGSQGRPARVRPARIGDSTTLGLIKRDAWRAAYRGLVPQSSLDDLDAEILADQFLAGLRAVAAGQRRSWAFLVVEDPAAVPHVVGYAICGPYRGDDLSGWGEVYALYVHPDQQGRGHGFALVRAAEAALAAEGFEHAALWVLTGNLRGRAFYESVGWSSDGTTDARCELDDAQETRYRRVLPAAGVEVD